MRKTAIRSFTVTDGSEEYVLVGNFTYISEGETDRSDRARWWSIPSTESSLRWRAMKSRLPKTHWQWSGIWAPARSKASEPLWQQGSFDNSRRILSVFMEEEPERLSEVKGISEKMAMAISAQVEEKREMRQAMLFLQQYGISMNSGVKDLPANTGRSCIR